MPTAIESGLTTNEAAFIEEARTHGELYIHQPYELYSEENHEAWRKLHSRMLPRWERYANEHFLKGIESLCLDSKRVPRLEDVNRFLKPLTGFQAKPVSGYIPAFLFFDCLRNREFPTTITNIVRAFCFFGRETDIHFRLPAVPPGPRRRIPSRTSRSGPGGRDCHA